MKKIIVFGASGGTGKHLVQLGLDAGYEVTAFVRRADALPKHDHLRLVVGDINNTKLISSAIKGQDAVLSALGPHNNTSSLCTKATTQIIAAMTAHKVKRLIVLSAYGASETRNSGLFSLMLWAMLKGKMLDKEHMEALICATSLDWTIVRPPALTNDAPKGKFKLGTKLPISFMSRISRADVAASLLSLLEHHTPQQALTVI